jgi:choline-sulfatase
MLEGQAPARERLVGYYGVPGSNHFKAMVREGEWKYIYMANGGIEQLFNVKEDPQELRQRIGDAPEVAARLRTAAVEAVRRPNANRALDADGALKKFPREELERQRIYQFDGSRGVRGFPERPQDVVRPAKPL